MAEILEAINQSSGNLVLAFETILRMATHFCDAAFGELWNYDRRALGRPVALVGVPEACTEFRARGGYKPGPGTFGALFEAGVVVPDWTDDDGQP